jgi:AraC-like DNA-binding protein
MEKTAIPRFELEAFAVTSYQGPVMQVQHHPLDAGYFIIENRASYPIIDYISPSRRDFYKIFHMTSGTGVLTVGLHQYEVGPGDIAFIHPDEIMSWRTTSDGTGGHFCLIHPKYFDHDAQHVHQLMKNCQYFKAPNAVVHLTADQSTAINHHFENILKEAQSDNEDKKQALLLYLQMILVEVQRAGKNMKNTAVNENYGYIYNFLSLLESSFQIHDGKASVKMKTAAEFADELHVHPNYLNALVKQNTGKTVREHIQERLLYEAKALLLRTDLTVSRISYGLGFSDPAAFTSFFKKKERISPSHFRKINVNQMQG